MDAFLQWLARVDRATLYAVACAAAAFENVFPPMPSDVVVTFAAFAAARSQGAQGSAAALLAAVVAANVAGAMLMYGLGARYGAAAVLKRLGGAGGQEDRLRGWYGRYGLVAIAVGRFLPGVRAVVPPVAGALGIGAVRSAAAMAVPSAIWYGGITYLAFTVGGDFDVLVARVGAGQRWTAFGAAGVAVVGFGAWLLHRRRRARA